jgi:hypothetical protein
MPASAALFQAVTKLCLFTERDDRMRGCYSNGNRDARELRKGAPVPWMWSVAVANTACISSRHRTGCSGFLLRVAIPQWIDPNFSAGPNSGVKSQAKADRNCSRARAFSWWAHSQPRDLWFSDRDYRDLRDTEDAGSDGPIVPFVPISDAIPPIARGARPG